MFEGCTKNSGKVSKVSYTMPLLMLGGGLFVWWLVYHIIKDRSDRKKGLLAPKTVLKKTPKVSQEDVDVFLEEIEKYRRNPGKDGP